MKFLRFIPRNLKEPLLFVNQKRWRSITMGITPAPTNLRPQDPCNSVGKVYDHPLINDLPVAKKPEQPYGVQGPDYLLPWKGSIAGRLPIKIKLKKDLVYRWCSCGYSDNQPFCDGSHNRSSEKPTTKLKPIHYIPDRDMEVWFCHCKQTNNRPFCDGSHKILPEEKAPLDGFQPVLKKRK